MKTAVSIPDRVFKAAERVSKRLGISRSRLYTLAIEKLLESESSGNITERLNHVYKNQDSRLDPVLMAMQMSSLRTIVVAAITSNLELAEAPGNVFCPRSACGLPRDSVINVSQVLTIDQGLLMERVGVLSASVLHQAEDGLRLLLAL